MYARLETVSRGLEWTGLRHRANYHRCWTGWPGPVRWNRCAFWRTRARSGHRCAPRRARLHQPDPSESIRGCRAAGERTGAPPGAGGARAHPGGSRGIARDDARVDGKRCAPARPPLAGNAFVGELAALSRELSQVGAIGLNRSTISRTARPRPRTGSHRRNRCWLQWNGPAPKWCWPRVRPVRLLVAAASKRNQGAFRR